MNSNIIRVIRLLEDGRSAQAEKLWCAKVYSEEGQGRIERFFHGLKQKGQYELAPHFDPELAGSTLSQEGKGWAEVLNVLTVELSRQYYLRLCQLSRQLTQDQRNRITEMRNTVIRLVRDCDQMAYGGSDCPPINIDFFEGDVLAQLCSLVITLQIVINPEYVVRREGGTGGDSDCK